jgi:hypothetical protein
MSEWLDCPLCHATRESGCACPNSKCADFNPSTSSFTRKVYHANLGDALVTEDCMRMQRTNPDKTSMFIEHDGELKEVTKALVTETDYMRADGRCVCDWCKKTYFSHPHYLIFLKDGHLKHEITTFSTGLHQLCDGRVVKT